MALLCVTIGYMLIRSISVPISAITAAMLRLADKDLAVDIPGVSRGDEIGLMAAAVAVFKDNMMRGDVLTAEAAAASRDRAALQSRSDTERAATAAEQARVVQAIAPGSTA